MSRLLLTACIAAFVTLAPPLARSQSPSFADLHRQADDAYCSRDFAKAISLSLAALELANANPEIDLAQRWDEIDRLAGANEKLRDYAAAERYYGMMLQNLEQQFGKDSLNAAFAMEALARILAKNGKVDEAEALYQRVTNARAQEFSVWTKQVNIPGFEVPDVYKSRRHANAGLIALKRKDWRKAFDEYQQSIMSIDENVAEMESGDSLADLSSEMNNATFVGLAQAAWELGNEPGQNLQALLGTSFESLQRKWRTAAALALQQAAARVPRVSAAGGVPAVQSRTTREAQDRQELLRRLEAELEDLTQAWFAKRGADQSYVTGEDELMDANRAYMAMGLEERSKVDAILRDMWGECIKQNPPCNVDMPDALARYRGEAKAGPSAGPTRADKLRNQERDIPGFEEYERKRIDLEVRIAELNGSGPINQVPPPQEYGSTTAPKSALSELSVAEVQGLLRDDEALLVHLIGDDEGFVWVVTRTGAGWSQIPIDNAYLEEAIATLRLALEPPGQSGTAASSETGRAAFSLTLAHELYTRLIAPVEGALAGKRHLIVVPTGLLTGLPFQVLVTQKPDAALDELNGYRKASWLARQYAVSTLPGVAALKSLRAGRLQPAAFPFLGFGDPDYAHTAAANTRTAHDVLATVSRCSRSKFPTDGKLQRLPDTAKEIQDVAKTFDAADSEVMLGDAASEARIRSMHEAGALFNYRVLYFATHGLVTGELNGLLEPALALTASQGNDGLFTATEITQLQLNADLVVLSACNTSSARRPGEETLSGLARAFLYAGARALLVSHWQADSFAASELMTHMFRHLAATPEIGRAEALRQAMLAIVDQGDIVGAHPSYWAPFVVVGEGVN